MLLNLLDERGRPKPQFAIVIPGGEVRIIETLTTKPASVKLRSRIMQKLGLKE